MSYLLMIKKSTVIVLIRLMVSLLVWPKDPFSSDFDYVYGNTSS